jgi:hypothetical protein
LWNLAGSVSSMTVDRGEHLWDLAELGMALRGDPVATTVPIGTLSDDEVTWDKTKADRFFDALANDRPLPSDLVTAG